MAGTSLAVLGWFAQKPYQLSAQVYEELLNDIELLKTYANHSSMLHDTYNNLYCVTAARLDRRKQVADNPEIICFLEGCCDEHVKTFSETRLKDTVDHYQQTISDAEQEILNCHYDALSFKNKHFVYKCCRAALWTGLIIATAALTYSIYRLLRAKNTEDHEQAGQPFN
jgi:hypothetical protein